jgi:hypothetical protein
MNIIKLQDELRGVPDNALIGYVQNPTGHVPSYLALSELQRRKDMRSKYESQQEPQSSVADDLEQEVQPQEAQGGLAMLAGQPQQDMSDQGVAGLPVPETMYQDQNFASGGIVAFDDGGEVPGFAGPGGSYVNPSMYGREVKEYKNPYKSMKLFGEEYNLYGDGLLGPNPDQDTLRAFNTLRQSKNPFVSGMPNTDLATEYQLLRLKASQNKADQKDYDRMAEINNSLKDAENYPIGGGATKESIAAAQKQDAAQAAVDAKKNPYKPLSDKEKENIKKQFGYGEGSVNTKSNAPAQQSGESEDDFLRKRMAIYKEFMGGDEDKTALKDKLSAMEKRAARQEDMAPWMALTEAGFKTMQGTSPYALANIGAGAEVGLKSYGGAQDKIAALEEKRYALMNDAAKADRAEKQAAITFGENSYQHKAAMDQRDRLADAANKLKSEEIGVQRARVDAISGKSNIKGMVDQILKANKEIDADLSIYNKIKKPTPERINYIKKLIQDKAANEAKIKSYYNQNKGGLANIELSESDPLGLLN